MATRRSKYTVLSSGQKGIDKFNMDRRNQERKRAVRSKDPDYQAAEKAYVAKSRAQEALKKATEAEAAARARIKARKKKKS